MMYSRRTLYYEFTLIIILQKFKSNVRMSQAADKATINVLEKCCFSPRNLKKVLECSYILLLTFCMKRGYDTLWCLGSRLLCLLINRTSVLNAVSGRTSHAEFGRCKTGRLVCREIIVTDSRFLRQLLFVL